jgi:hypothetical protein
MNNHIPHPIKTGLPLFLALVALNFCRAQEEIIITQTGNVILARKPIPVSLEGFTGEAAGFEV